MNIHNVGQDLIRSVPTFNSFQIDEGVYIKGKHKLDPIRYKPIPNDNILKDDVYFKGIIKDDKTLPVDFDYIKKPTTYDLQAKAFFNEKREQEAKEIRFANIMSSEISNVPMTKKLMDIQTEPEFQYKDVIMSDAQPNTPALSKKRAYKRVKGRTLPADGNASSDTVNLFQKLNEVKEKQDKDIEMTILAPKRKLSVNGEDKKAKRAKQTENIPDNLLKKRKGSVKVGIAKKPKPNPKEPIRVSKRKGAPMVKPVAKKQKKNPKEPIRVPKRKGDKLVNPIVKKQKKTEEKVRGSMNKPLRTMKKVNYKEV
jgi:hypothetical protein